MARMVSPFFRDTIKDKDNGKNKNDQKVEGNFIKSY